MKTLLFIFIFILTGCGRINNGALDEEEVLDKIESVEEGNKDDLIKDEIYDDDIIEDDNICDDEIITDNLNEDLNRFIDKYQMNYRKYNLSINNSYNYSSNGFVSYYLFDNISVKNDLIKINTKSRPGIKRDVKWIVIHDTGNVKKTANALNHSNYLKNLAIENKTSVSWHYSVDMDNIIRHIPDLEVAYHAGDGLKNVGEGNYLGGGNKNGIGIEMCVNEGNDILLTYRRVAKLTAKLLIEYNLDTSRVKRHYDFSGKKCPNSIMTNDLWEEFLHYVKAEYEYLKYYSNYKIEIINNKNVSKNGRILSKDYKFDYLITDLKTSKEYIKKCI